MNGLLQPLLIHTRDPERLRAWSQAVTELAAPREVSRPEEVDVVLDEGQGAILLVDVRSQSFVASLLRRGGDTEGLYVIAFGEPRSEPLLSVERRGVFAILSLAADRREIQHMVQKALQQLALWREVLRLREQVARAAAPPPPPPPERAHPAANDVRQFTRALRRIVRPDELYETMVENLAAWAGVTRAGLFGRRGGDERYRWLAGINDSAAVQGLVFETEHRLVQWLSRNACAASAANLEHVPRPTDREIVRQALSLLGAEVLVPLFVRGRLLGWFFAGRRLNGVPFGVGDLEELAIWCEQAAITIENAWLYEEAAVQRTLAESLLNHMPTGVVAADAGGTVRWLNRAAQEILSLPEPLLNQPIHRLGMPFADLLRRELAGEHPDPIARWKDPATGRTLSVRVLALGPGAPTLGAMALVDDHTAEAETAERQEKLERTAFWHEMAAGLSQELREPLVSIKTFLQLVESRYHDPEFRRSFGPLLSGELARVDELLARIAGMSSPPPLVFDTLEPAALLREAVRLARERTRDTRTPVRLEVPEDAPHLRGDARVLEDAFAHLIANAFEAVSGHPDGLVRVHAEAATGHGGPRLLVRVEDNGSGIPRESLGRVFSPFFTTKSRGVGLGLPVARRAVRDHHGDIVLDCREGHTQVEVTLPAGGAGPEADHEDDPRSG